MRPHTKLRHCAHHQSNLHSLNSWPAVQCNEGFCNALDRRGSILTTITASQKPHHSANSERQERGEEVTAADHLILNFRDAAPPSPRGVLANATPRRFPFR